MSRLERLEKVLNKTSGNPYHDEKGRFTFNPGQGRGIGKHARGFSSPTVIYTGDDIALEKDGVLLEGTLQYKDGKFYLLTDKKESRLIEISKDDVRRSIVTKSAKQKKKELLESQGIRHKTPKERRTPEQKRLISELDKIGLFKDKELKSWCMQYSDEETLSDIYTALREAESLGLDISSIQLGKIRSGKTWGMASYITDGNFKLSLSGKVYDRNPIQEKEINECRKGFHTANSIKAVVRHETGHIISYQNAQRSYNTKDKPENIWQQEDKVDSYCGKVVSEAMGYSYFTYRETLKDLKKYSNSEISEYGRTNFKEAIAESWSNPNYSSFTKKVSDILKRDLKKPKENSIMNKRIEEIQICSGYGPEFEDFEYETSTGKVKTNSRIVRLHDLEKVINSQKENLDYRYDVKAYKEYLKEWLKHKDEKEYLDGGVLSFAEFWEHDIDYEFEDYKKILKLIDEYNKKKELVTNGGPGSGNFNPGQGRGVGKPANGHTSKSATQYSADKYLTRAEHENIINYSSEDNFTDDELDAIASYTNSMRYGASSDLNQAIRENDFGEIIEKENIEFPKDNSQIVTWKENREFLENKIKEKEAYDKLQQEYKEFRKKHEGDANYRDEIIKRVEEVNSAYRKLDYSDYSNYIENYKNGVYKNLKDDDKLWTIDNNKIEKVSIVELRKEQKNNPKEFYEKINIPRLTWSTYNSNPTTTDTMATVYGNDFKDLDKLDNIIKNKGFVLDKDITVTRRVANAKVIENQIKNKGEYTQNGITSVTAARSIAKKMPSGVNMGDDLLRITIPAGTKVISTYNPFVRDVQKSADKYNGGNLTVDDKRNLRMIKGQNELILPSGSKFVSPKGNSISKNEDGSYQLILKVENDKTSKNSLKISDYLRNNQSAKSYFRSQRLFVILNKVNRGNPYHDEKGRFASNDGLIKNISKKWEKYSISLNSGKLFNDVMEKNGWYRNKDGTWETSKKINSIKLGKIDKKSEEIVYNNGKKYVSHDSTENYKSKWSDEDAPAFYTTDSREDAEIYNDGDWSKTITLVVNKKNFISDKELDKIRDKIELESGFKFSKKSFPDTVLADELGKSGIIRKTDIGTEYISLNLDNFKEFRNK